MWRLLFGWDPDGSKPRSRALTLTFLVRSDQSSGPLPAAPALTSLEFLSHSARSSLACGPGLVKKTSALGMTT